MFSGAIRLIKLGATVMFSQTVLSEDTNNIGVTVEANRQFVGCAGYTLDDAASMRSLNKWFNELADAIERGEYGVIRFAY